MKLLLLIFLLFAISCSANKKDPQYGKTTLPELINLKGQPEKEEAIPLEGEKIVHYVDDEKFQIKNDVVTHRYRNPTKEEVTLIYWKHAFKDCAITITKTNEKKNDHELAEFLMKCDASGTAVVYFENSDLVLRVIEYEKK